MTNSKSTTRQSTIMFTDIVGYSKMVEKNEKHAIKILNEHDKLIEKMEPVYTKIENKQNQINET